MPELPTVAELQSDIARLRGKIAPLQQELQVTEDLLQQVYLKQSGLVGKRAVSDRIPAGIIIEAVKFYTWAAHSPQIVYGYRVGTQTWSGIPVTSKGFQIHDQENHGDLADRSRSHQLQ